MALAGAILNVSGSKSAMVATGPIPGNTPISVPKNTPMKHDNKLMGSRATEKPTAKLASTSRRIHRGRMPGGNGVSNNKPNIR